MFCNENCVICGLYSFNFFLFFYCARASSTADGVWVHDTVFPSITCAVPGIPGIFGLIEFLFACSSVLVNNSFML